jgi:hypothetical protein
LIIVDNSAFPQDPGTGLAGDVSDFDDAASFAQHRWDPSIGETGFVVATGGDIHADIVSADFVNGVANVSECVCWIYQETAKTMDHQNENGPPPIVKHHTTFVEQYGPSGDFSISLTEPTKLYLRINHNSNDDIQLKKTTTGSEPAEPNIHIATLTPGPDAGNSDDGEVEERNRRPFLQGRRMEVW